MTISRPDTEHDHNFAGDDIDVDTGSPSSASETIVSRTNSTMAGSNNTVKEGSTGSGRSEGTRVAPGDVEKPGTRRPRVGQRGEPSFEDVVVVDWDGPDDPDNPKK